MFMTDITMLSMLRDVVNHAPDGHEFKVVGVGGLVLDGGDVANHALDRRFGTSFEVDHVGGVHKLEQSLQSALSNHFPRRLE